MSFESTAAQGDRRVHLRRDAAGSLVVEGRMVGMPEVRAEADLPPDGCDWVPPVPGKPATYTSPGSDLPGAKPSASESDPTRPWFNKGRDTHRSPATGKGRYDLLSRAGIHALALRLEMGADTHGDRSWEKCGDVAGLARFRESMLRHAFQAADGMTDEDHLAAVMFNSMALIHFRDAGDGIDRGPRVGG